MSRRLLITIVFAGLFGMVFMPLVAFGQLSNSMQNFFGNVQPPSVTNVPDVASRINARVTICATEAAGGAGQLAGILGNAGFIAGTGGLGALTGGFGQLSGFASSIPGIGKLFGGLGGGGSSEEVEVLNKICDETKKHVNLLKEQQRQQNRQAALKKWGAVAYKNAITIFFNRLANRMALKLATGLTGQKSTIRSSYDLKDELDAVAGEFVDKALRNVWGKSLCEPLTPFAKVNLAIFTRRFVEPQLPQCTASKILKSVGDSLSNIQDYQDILDLGGYVSPSGNDLGAILTITTNLKIKVGEEKEKKRIEQIVGEGFKDVTSKVTGLIKTPSTIIKSATDEYLIKGGTNPYLVFTGEAAADAIGIFTNTLAGKVLERYLFKQGLNPEADLARGGGVSNIFSLGIQTINAAAQKFARLIETPDLRTGSKVDIVQSLSDRNQEDPYACIIDDRFRLAIEHEPPMTLEQATAGVSPFISPSRIFGSHGSGRGKNDTLCDDPNLYSLRSIRILRKYRIVPVGWELAAEYIAERASFDRRTKEFTLDEVMKEYNNPVSPFYMLVDPAWVLKAPENFVRRQGYGEAQEDADDDSFARRYGPVDEQSCIKENKDGSCAWYGYCVEEKPTWRIDGTECQAQFNTCTTYTSRTGRSVSLLSNSLDHNFVCSTPEAVGCRQYCAYDAVLGDFNCTGSTTYSPTNRFGPTIYLNANAPSCSAGAAGCNEYLVLRDKETGLLLNSTELQTIVSSAVAGDYTSGDPLTKTDGGYYSSQALAQRIMLKGEVQECAPEFAGCDLYTPLRGREPAIPAIIGSQCLAQCVGYRSFKESYSYFDNPSAPWPAFNPKPGTVDFIPSLARSCRAQAAGCEEFTNLEDAGSGGEQREYFTYLRQCVKPTGGSVEQVFYTWEGSDTTGFQLKEWILLPAEGENRPAGTRCSPAEADPSNVAYNPDCRTFYNAGAETFTVLQSTAIFASDECTQFRRTKDGNVWWGIPSQGQRCSASENMCLQYKGSSSNNVRVVKLGSSSTGVETFDGAQSCGSGTSATICGWSAPPSALSAESIAAGGKSLKIPLSVRTTSSLQLKEGASYELSFWFKGDLDEVRIAGTNGSQSFITGGGTSYPQWSYARFMLGTDGYLTFVPDLDNKTYLEIVSSSSGYIDNITLSESPDNLYFIQNSWVANMPKDEATGAPLCDATQIGCQAYRNSRGQTVYANEFASLCPLSAVGCVAAVDTKDSSKTLATNVRGVSTPADSVIHVIDNPKAYCQPQEKGCVRLGMVDTSSNRTPKFTNTHKIVDPDRYQQTLCLAEQDYCESFTTEDGLGATTFKDPTNFTCEFKANVSSQAGLQRVSGWFVKGTTIPCPTIATPQSGVVGRCFGGKSTEDPFGNTCSSNTSCTNHASPGKTGFCVSTSYTSSTVTPESTSNFAGSNLPFGATCPSSQSSCFELQDPQNPSGCDNTLLFGEVSSDPDVKSCNYYYYLSDSLASSGCDKQNPDEGCVGFLDTSRMPTFSTFKQCLNTNGTPVLPAVQCRIDAECVTGRCGYP